MKIGIAKNFKVVKVYGGIDSGTLANNVCWFYREKGGPFPMAVEYPNEERAADALEKILKKDYLVVPEEYLKLPTA